MCEYIILEDLIMDKYIYDESNCLLSKCSLMREYPHLYAFSLRAYYETAPEIQNSI